MILIRTNIFKGHLALPMPFEVKNAVYAFIYRIADTSIKHTISLQFTPMLKSCIYVWYSIYCCKLYKHKRIDCLLVSAGFLPREKEVPCNYSAMHILCFYFVRQTERNALWEDLDILSSPPPLQKYFTFKYKHIIFLSNQILIEYKILQTQPYYDFGK